MRTSAVGKGVRALFAVALAVATAGAVVTAPAMVLPSSTTVDATTSQGSATERLAGSTRFGTAAAIAGHAYPEGADSVFVARADEFPDALAASSLDGPVLLVPTAGVLPEGVAAELERLDPVTVTALGGTSAVSDAMLLQAGGHPPPPESFASLVGVAESGVSMVDVAATDDGGAIVVGWASDTTDFGGTVLEVDDASAGFVLRLDRRGEVVWVRRAGDGTVTPSAVDLAPDGTALVTGGFHGTVTIGDATLVSDGGSDGTTFAIDGAGEIVWAARTGHSDAWVGPEDLVAAGDGGAYIVGRFSDGTATFGNHSVEGPTGDAGFLARISADGDVDWARALGTSDSVVTNAAAVTVTSGGDVLVAGEFAGDVDFDGATLASEGGPLFGDGFVLRANADGETLWASRAGASAEGLVAPQGMVGDGEGGAIVAGTFEQDATFRDQRLEGGSQGNPFVLHIDADGELTWARKPARTGEDELTPTAIAALPDGGAVIGGVFDGTVVLRDRSLTSNGHSDGVVFRMDGDGDLRWATHAIRSDERVQLGGITATTGGGAVLVGGLRDAATIGSQTVGIELEAESPTPTPPGGISVIGYPGAIAASIDPDGALE